MFNPNKWIVKLPYNSLEPYMSNETLKIHYNVHHTRYAQNLFNALPDEHKDWSLEKIMKYYASSNNKSITNNMNQVFCHNFFWTSLQPSELQDNLVFKNKMILYIDQVCEASRKLFGSGYVWIISNKGVIEVKACANADIPAGTLLACIDIWEHAFYLDYQYRKDQFIENIFRHCMNWATLAERFGNADMLC